MRLPSFRSPVTMEPKLDFKDVLEIVSTISCHNYHIRAWPNVGINGNTDTFNIYCSLKVPDSLHPGHDTTVTNYQTVTLKGLTREKLLQDTRSCIWNLAIHEIDEWFTVGSEKPFYPHQKEV